MYQFKFRRRRRKVPLTAPQSYCWKWGFYFTFEFEYIYKYIKPCFNMLCAIFLFLRIGLQLGLLLPETFQNHVTRWIHKRMYRIVSDYIEFFSNYFHLKAPVLQSGVINHLWKTENCSEENELSIIRTYLKNRKNRVV